MKKLILLFAIMSLNLQAHAQITLNLQKAIEIANDSSLTAFRYQNMYLAGYWEYRTYKANRLPSMSLNLMPAQYYRYITQRYDSNRISTLRAVRSTSIPNWSICATSAIPNLPSSHRFR